MKIQLNTTDYFVHYPVLTHSSLSIQESCVGCCNCLLQAKWSSWSR